jgi:probable F420-dependent oxidoreductase
MEIGMNLPIMVPGFDRDRIHEWCRRIDAGPYSSLAVGERINFPNPAPLATLCTAAALTQRVRIMPYVLILPMHSEVAMAKELATLDWLSKGRLVFGIGYGWNHEEMENHGIDVKRRRARVRETMLAMQALWANEVASFEGEFVRFEPSWQWPKPVQQPRPRILIGGAAGPKLFSHIAEYADGWMPIGGAGMAAELERLRAALRERDRDPNELHIVPMGIFPTDEKLAYYQGIGVTEAVLRVPSATRDEVLPVLDDYVRFVDAF